MSSRLGGLFFVLRLSAYSQYSPDKPNRLRSFSAPKDHNQLKSVVSFLSMVSRVTSTHIFARCSQMYILFADRIALAWPVGGKAHPVCQAYYEPTISCYDDDSKLDDGVCTDCRQSQIAWYDDPALCPYERYRWLRLKGLIRGSVTTLS